MALKRSKSGIQPATPHPSPIRLDQSETALAAVPEASLEPPAKRTRRVKTKRPNQGDSPHLKQWREYYNSWAARHGAHETVMGMKHIDKAKAAGVAYRHKNQKKRADDPAEPEFPF